MNKNYKCPRAYISVCYVPSKVRMSLGVVSLKLWSHCLFKTYSKSASCSLLYSSLLHGVMLIVKGTNQE